jgi:hypothetical protein
MTIRPEKSQLEGGQLKVGRKTVLAAQKFTDVFTEPQPVPSDLLLMMTVTHYTSWDVVVPIAVLCRSSMKSMLSIAAPCHPAANAWSPRV